MSIVIPAHNEEQGIARQLAEVRAVMEQLERPYELIVVDDGSSDSTAQRARQPGVHLLQLRPNRGYGAALKAGIAAARYDWILITDADCTYPAEHIPGLLEGLPDFDMVVGARTGPQAHIPLARRPAKWFLTRLASLLARQPIPDLNSGLRLIRKALVHKYQHLLPDRFSFTTTITLVLLSNGFLVHYVPISYRLREGASKIRPFDAVRFLVQVLRTVGRFYPLRIFLPLGLAPFLAGVLKLAWDLRQREASPAGLLGVLAAIVIWGAGLLADRNARPRRNR